MCTVSVIPMCDAQPFLARGVAERDGVSTAAGFRLVMNRDESRSRPAGLTPSVFELPSGQSAVWPTDPAGGGTWVGANQSGVALALLNIYSQAPGVPRPSDAGMRAPTSRGMLIPALIDAGRAPDVAARLTRVDLGAFRPFRLICADAVSVFECRWDGLALSIADCPMGPCCFSSHGWGDRFARPRLELFRSWFAARPLSAQEQDAYHRHRWSGRPATSVRMAREESRTVSITSIDVAADGEVEMVHEALDSGAEETRVRLTPVAGPAAPRAGALA